MEELRRLIRLNEKKRQINDGWNINPEEFSINELLDEKPEIIDVTPVNMLEGETNEAVQ